MVGSIAGMEGQKGQVIYSATKGAVNAMAIPMARDLGKYKIRVMTIAPGVFHTPMGDMIQQKALDHIKSQVPVNRLGRPE